MGAAREVKKIRETALKEIEAEAQVRENKCDSADVTWETHLCV